MAAIPETHLRDLGLIKVAKSETAKPDDSTGFRMGTERLVSKKKNKSLLKRLIVAEREVRLQDGAGPPSDPLAKPMMNATQASCSSDAFSVDAPEFLPRGWVSSAPATESVADTNHTGERVLEVLPRKEQDGRKKGPTVLRKAPDFVPSWVQAAEFVPSWCQPEPSDNATASTDVAASARATASTELPENEELAVSQAIERMAAQTKDEKGKGAQAKKQKKPAQTANLEVRHYVRQVLSDELDEKVKAMLGDLARFQERARLDPLKFAKLKRFCVGMSEATRSVKRGKAKCLIVAPNLDRSEADGGLDDTVENLIDACAEFEVPVLFALSRNRMGKALGKNIRMSIVCVLSAEGVHQEVKQIIKLAEELRKQWVMRRMALGAQEVMPVGKVADANGGESGSNDEAQMSECINDKVLRHLEEQRLEDERRRAEEKAKRDAERAAQKAVKQAERRARQEEHRAAKALENAEEERKEQEEEKLKADEEAEKRRIASIKEAERQQLIEKARQEKERRAQDEQRRIAEQLAKDAAEAGGDGEDSSDDDNLPAGFNADFF